jgi:hypothetical protein
MTKARQHHRHFVLTHTLEIVGAIHSLKLLRLQAGELSDIENDVGSNRGIQVEQNLLKRAVGGRQLDAARLATHVQDTSPWRRCF